ncbi:MAG: hypothetical protein R3B13_08245 [Polyangiaceae bacterium]
MNAIFFRLSVGLVATAFLAGACGSDGDGASGGGNSGGAGSGGASSGGASSGGAGGAAASSGSGGASGSGGSAGAADASVDAPADAADAGADACAPDSGTPEICNGQDDDCDGTIDNGNPGGGAACNTGKPDTCADGIMTCADGKLSCKPKTVSTEACNLLDDDCNGVCDDANCRVGVHRAFNSASNSHILTTNLAETTSSGFVLESQDSFYLYTSGAGSAKLLTFYRCLKPNGKQFYSSVSNCEGGGSNLGILGYMGNASAGCGSVPLYRLHHNGFSDHFYTASATERDAAVTKGYVLEGTVGYVWAAP